LGNSLQEAGGEAAGNSKFEIRNSKDLSAARIQGFKIAIRDLKAWLRTTPQKSEKA